MWPFERSVASHVIRVGRNAVELWTCRQQAPVHLGAQRLDGAATDPVRELGRGLLALVSDAPRTVSVVVESAWLPVLAFDVGPRWLGTAELVALGRHRLGLHYDSAVDPIAAWDVRIEHRPGEQLALAFGLAPSVRTTILEAIARANVRSTALSPAFSWARRPGGRTRPRGKTARWWLWPEQDRTLIARFRGDALVALHPGAPALAKEATIAEWLDAECVRLGLDPHATSDPCTVASWAETLSGPKRASERKLPTPSLADRSMKRAA